MKQNMRYIEFNLSKNCREKEWHHNVYVICTTMHAIQPYNCSSIFFFWVKIVVAF